MYARRAIDEGGHAAGGERCDTHSLARARSGKARWLCSGGGGPKQAKQAKQRPWEQRKERVWTGPSSVEHHRLHSSWQLRASRAARPAAGLRTQKDRGGARRKQGAGQGSLHLGGGSGGVELCLGGTGVELCLLTTLTFASHRGHWHWERHTQTQKGRGVASAAMAHGRVGRTAGGDPEIQSEGARGWASASRHRVVQLELELETHNVRMGEGSQHQGA